MRRHLAGWLWSLSIGAWLSSAGAQLAEPRSTSETNALLQRVEVTLVGDLGRDPVFAARVTSWFDPVRFDVEVKSARSLDPRRVLAPDRRGVVFVWVTLRPDRSARLFFASNGLASQEKTSYLLRELSLSHGLDELGAERIAQVLNLSTVALLEGQAESGRDEMERTLDSEITEAPPTPSVAAPAPPTPPAPPPSPAPRHPPIPGRLSWSLSAGYGVAARGDEGVWHGPRTSASLAARGAGAGLLSLGAALPNTRRVGSLDLRFWGFSALVAVALEQRPNATLRVLEFAGPGLEWTRYTPVGSHEMGVRPGNATGEFRPRLALGVSLAFGRAPGVALVLEASWLLRHTDYELVAGTSRERIGVTPTWVPSAALEVGLF